MKFIELFRKENIFLIPPNISKWTVLKYMVQHSKSISKGTKEYVITALMNRGSNRLFSYGSGIAIPHAPIENINSHICMLAFSVNGIQWGAVDEKDVHLIAVIVSPSNELDTYRDTMSQITDLLLNKGHEIIEIVKACENNCTIDFVLNKIDQYELLGDNFRKEEMKQRKATDNKGRLKIKILNPNGIHARPSAHITRCAHKWIEKFHSRSLPTVLFCNDSISANPLNVMEVLLLCAPYDSTIEISYNNCSQLEIEELLQLMSGNNCKNVNSDDYDYDLLHYTIID